MMKIQDAVCVITGGSGGIGKAMAAAFLEAGAEAVVLADLDASAVQHAATELNCEGRVCNVTDESDIVDLVRHCESRYGRIDLFCSNAGAGGEGVLTDAENAVWQLQWELHVMSHVYAARAVLPGMLERGQGYLLNTASAAGLLAALGSGPYSVTKAAAVKLAEFIAITHGDDGIGVSVLCPQGVNTAMAPRSLGDGQTDGIIEPEALAQTVLEALEAERFHVLPHPEVKDYVRRKGDDIDRWLHGMRRLKRQSQTQ
jgi:NAD(P)-dependent dehydrogenase (short-subunit alcohol dehydrogenase family)